MLPEVGLIYRDNGDFTKSIDFYNNALRLYKEIGNRQGESNVLNNLGDVYFNFNKPIKAIELYNQSPFERVRPNARQND